MRYQRNEQRGSRPEGLGHPHSTRHTAASYHAKCLVGGNVSLNRLLRYMRMLKKEQD